MSGETWKDVPGFEGRYRVSDQGRVWSVLAGRAMRNQRINSGYQVLHFALGRARLREVRLVHRLVAEAFCGSPRPGEEVNHKDGDKTNNCATNLEWVTRQENVAHARANGLLRAPRHAVKGVSLATGESVFFSSQSAAEKAFAGRNTSAVHNCITGKSRSAFGFTWERAK